MTLLYAMMRILIPGALSLLLVGGVFGQSRPLQLNGQSEILQRTVSGNDAKLVTTAEAFHASLGQARVPGGVIRTINCQGDTFKQTWKPHGLPLGQLLNEITGADSRYRWELNGEVINLLPTSGEPLLLQTHIREFTVRNTTSSLDALNQLIKRDEVKEAMVNLHLKGGLTLINYLSSPREFSVHFDGGTLRQALNKIATSQGTDIWDYTETHCGEKNEVTISF